MKLKCDAAHKHSVVEVITSSRIDLFRPQFCHFNPLDCNAKCIYNLSPWTVIRPKLILLKEELYLEGPEVHVFIMEVGTLCQLGKMAFGEGKSEKYTDSLVSHHPLLIK